MLLFGQRLIFKAAKTNKFCYCLQKSKVSGEFLWAALMMCMVCAVMALQKGGLVQEKKGGHFF